MKTYGIEIQDIMDYVEGNNYHGHEIFGAHIQEEDGEMGVRFSVYAPHALSVRLVGDFNEWDASEFVMDEIEDTGVFVCFVKDVGVDSLYKFVIESKEGKLLWKNDPYGTKVEQRVQGASIVSNIEAFKWTDQTFLKQRKQLKNYDQPISIYECNLSSWKKDEEKYYTYEKLEKELIPYVKDLGFTHIELMPVTEHPYDGSWGYQQTGYYAITSRFGSPREFMKFVNSAHEQGIGIIMDWVPVHYPKDANGLSYFDGEALYESPYYHDAYNPQWDTLNFDYGRRHVRNFMISNCSFLAQMYHIDGFRVDAVADLLYSEFREDGNHEKNQHGIAFIRQLNQHMQSEHPGVLMMAEESTAFYGVTKDISDNGLGFDLKWNMGWMNDTLTYFSMDPYFRQFHHNKLTFPMVYAFSEKHLLPFSHDEVVHGKKSLLEKMPGDYQDKFSQLKALFVYQYTQPGKKLLFMGDEFAQFIEWNEWQALDWHLLEYESHRSIQDFVREMNRIYRSTPALYEIDQSWEGYEWISVDNAGENVITYKRIDKENREVIVAINLSKEDRFGYQTPVEKDHYRVILNSDEKRFFGSNRGSLEDLRRHKDVLLIDIPGYSAVIIEQVEEEQ